MKNLKPLILIVVAACALTLFPAAARAVTFGTWQGPVTIQSGDTISCWSATADSLGRVHAVWGVGGSPATTLYYSRKDAASAWTTPEVIDSSTDGSLYIEANNVGGLVVMIASGGTYSAFIRLNHNGQRLPAPASLNLNCSAVDLTDGGTVYAICEDATTGRNYLYYWNGSNWSHDESKYFMSPVVKAGTDGKAYVVEIQGPISGVSLNVSARIYKFSPSTLAWTYETVYNLGSMSYAPFIVFYQLGFNRRNQPVPYYYSWYLSGYYHMETWCKAYERQVAGGYSNLPIPTNNLSSTPFVISTLKTGFGLTSFDTNSATTDFRLFETTTTPITVPSTIFNSLPNRMAVHTPGNIYMIVANGASLVSYSLSTTLADWDSDGLPSEWELLNGCMMGNTADATADYDSDGSNNQAEYLASTNPCPPYPYVDTDSDGTPDYLDCGPTDPNNWNSCATCLDLDADGIYTGCDRYATITGPDCNDVNINAWNTCATCLDGDGDGWYQSCNQYLTVNGPDCDDANINTWNTCATCVDVDADGWYQTCNQYLTVNGPDCGDANPFSWNTCAICVDTDLDSWYLQCNRYSYRTGDTVTIGTGTGSQNWPLASFFHDARSQLIYLRSEIGGAGTITSLLLDVTTIPGQILNSFTIRMKHTSASSYSAVAWESTGWATVYQANTLINATGWNNFTLSTPFAYNGTSNLMVDISFNNSSSSGMGYVHYTTAGATRALFYNCNSACGDPLTWNGTTPAATISVKMPNIRLIMITPSINGPDCDDSPATGPTCHDSCSSFYVDQDTDSYGDPATIASGKCVAPAGYVSNSTDCAPTIVTIHPGQPSPEGPGALCDGLDNQCPGETGYGTVDEGCGITDTDGDGLSDGQEIIIGTNPNVADTDGDGLNDGEEYNTRGTNPLGWDSDSDALPDAFEVANLAGHTVGLNLDPLAAADGAADFDLDGIVNADDYWNGGGSMSGGSGGAVSGGGAWVADKVGWPACGYWGEGDGDGFISPSDLAVISLAVKGSPDYAAVYPPTGETQDLDADGFLSPSDRGLLSSMIKGQTLTVLGSRPTVVSRVVPATGVNLSGSVGDTVSITVSVTSTSTLTAPGIPIVFSIEPSSTGGAKLLGGEGTDAPTTRYDLTTSRIDGGQASVTLVLTAAGTVTIEAKVKQCGADGIGRYCAEVLLAESVTITVTP